MELKLLHSNSVTHLFSPTSPWHPFIILRKLQFKRKQAGLQWTGNFLNECSVQAREQFTSVKTLFMCVQLGICQGQPPTFGLQLTSSKQRHFTSVNHCMLKEDTTGCGLSRRRSQVTKLTRHDYTNNN